MKKVKSIALNGFTLIELIIVIVLLAGLSIMSSSYIRHAILLYNNNTMLESSLSNIRFVIERLRQETSSVLPHSIAVNDDCLTFTPFIDFSQYGEDFPFYPAQANRATIVPLSNNMQGIKVAVNILSQQELSPSSSKVKNIADYVSGSNQITFLGDVSFPSASTEHTLYFIRENITYCFENNALYRQVDHQNAVLMAKNITGKFLKTRQNKSLGQQVNIKYYFNVDEEEITVEQALWFHKLP